MIPSGDDAGRGPDRHDDGSDDAAYLRALVEVEPVAGSEEEIDDAFAALAVLLLDLQSARQPGPDRGFIPTPPMSAPKSQCVPRQRRPAPSLVGGTEA